jgi:hypothetical protein
MTTSAGNVGAPARLTLSGRARHVSFGDDTLIIDLEDGRQLAVPIAWFPRLAQADPAQRSKWELVGRGIGISWRDIDEDISVENLLQKDGELMMARDLGMGMEQLAINMVKGWTGSEEDLISRLSLGGWFSNRRDAELWLLKQRKAIAEQDHGNEETPAE